MVQGSHRDIQVLNYKYMFLKMKQGLHKTRGFLQRFQIFECVLPQVVINH